MRDIETEPSIEKEPTPKDITEEFLSMSPMEFLDFLRTQRKEPALSIVIDWGDTLGESIPIRLKAFLEDSDAISRGQKRTATIRATEFQKEGSVLSKSNCRNAFASGVKWERIEEEK